MLTADATAIANAAHDVLADDSHREAAKQVATTITSYRGTSQAVPSARGARAMATRRSPRTASEKHLAWLEAEALDGPPISSVMSG
jgi:hypothetical protein